MENEIDVFNKESITTEFNIKNDDNKKENIYGDDFWVNDYKILFSKDNLSKFLPNVNMTNIEKLNSIMRLGIYLGLALFIFTGKK